VTIAGGKWTTYRKMGEDAVTQAARFAGLPSHSCKTENLPLHGWLSSVDPRTTCRSTAATSRRSGR
jgi:Glycerol-3-phosphate dehydrogenase